MDNESILRIVVAASAGFAVVGLLLLVAGSRSLGKKTIHAEPNGSGARGVWYAFFKGMLPWEKESVAKHLPTFVAGLFYHAGIFAALLFLLTRMLHVTPLDWQVPTLRVFLAIGLVCGLGLLIKRFSLSKMRLISTVDDALANLLVDLFLMAALISSFSPGYRSALYIVAILLFVYVPLGKIRHCVFFFLSRIVFGLFFGRRGVLPPSYGQRGVK